MEFYTSEHHWDDYSSTFSNVIEYNLMQTAITLYTHTRAWQAKTILDAGTGTGRSSRMLVNSFMQPGSALYWTDFSQKMIEAAEQSFINSELSGNDKVNLTKLSDAELIEVQKYDPENKTKNVFLVVADNSKLPFADEQFDLFVSGYWVQYSDDPKSQINEAYRVLQKDGI